MNGWEIKPNGSNIDAVHRITGEVFSGTYAAFNARAETAASTARLSSLSPNAPDALNTLGVNKWADKGGGAVMIDWANVTIGTPTTGWTVQKSTSKTYAGFQSLSITALAGAADVLTCTLTIPSTYLGAAKRLCYAICPGDDYVSGSSNNPVQLWFIYSAGNQHRTQMSTPPSYAADAWCESGPLYDQALAGTGHITNTTYWAKVGSEETTSITLVMSKRTGLAITTPVYIGPVYTDPVRTSQAVMTLFMDGGYSGQYKYARQLLQANNIRASLATTFQNIGVTGMTEAEILKMYSLGHELIHHTGTAGNVGWDDTGKYPNGQEYALVKADIKAGFDWMTARGVTRGKGYCVVGYTNGLVNTQTYTRRQAITDALRDSGVLKCRQLGAYNASYYGCAGERDVVITHSQMATAATSTATLTGIIDQMIANGGWSGLTFHDFVLSGATGNSYNVSDFKTVIDYIATKVNAGVLRVMPFSEAMQAISATPKPQ